MEKINYSQIYTKFTKGLLPKTKDIFDRRFGVNKNKDQGKSAKNQVLEVETLESIGKSLGITRERVRQIEEVGFKYIKKNNKEALDTIFAEFNAYFESKGGFKKEEILFEDFGGQKNKPYVLFLLPLVRDQFFRVCDKKDHHYFWSTAKNSVSSQNYVTGKIKDTLNSLVQDIKKHGNLSTKDELLTNFASKYSLGNEAFVSYLEISKKIQQNKEEKFGLIEWPEIKPRGVKDKAFLVFKQHQKPLHFRAIAELIDQLEYNKSNQKTHSQTVHNELIKDARFVLVGRGMYALGEWGYVPGTIKDIISKVLTEKPQLISQEEIVKEVLSQRLVAKNTVMINLNNKKYFNKNSDGKYFLTETQTA